MARQQAPQTYRIAVDAVADLTTLFDARMADGTDCWVNAAGVTHGKWCLDKTSVLVANGTTVVATLSGVGRWIFFGAGASTGTGNMMWFETIALMGAAPGPAVNTGAVNAETGAEYEFIPADVTAVNGFTVVANTGGTNGRWLLKGDFISLAPRGGGLDDWPRLNLAMIACANNTILRMRSGQWACATPGQVPSGTQIEMEAGVTIVSTMASTGGQTNSVFFAQVALAAGTTPITASTTPGSNQVLVTSVVAPNVIAIGTKVYLSNGLQSQFYTVINVVGQTLTLNRPINWVCPVATGVVGVWTSLPTNILIFGNNATVTGTGDRVVEIGGGQNCHVYDLSITDTAGQFSNAVLAFDVGGLDCSIERCRVRYNTAGGFYGIALESCESSHIVECDLSAGITYGICLIDGISCSITRCLASGCANGAFIGYDAALAGCFDCSIVGGTYSRCSTAGVTVQGGSGTGAIRTKLIGVSTLGNVVGIFLSLQTKTQVLGCSGDTDTNGLSVAATSVDATISNYTTRNNDIGLVLTGGATGTKLNSVTTDTTATNGISIACEAKIHGLTIKAATGRCMYIPSNPGVSLLVDGFDFQLTGGGVPQHVELYSGAVGGVTGYVTFRDGKLTNTASCFGFVLQVANVVLTLDNVVAVTASNQAGVFANAAGMVRRNGYTDLSVFTTPYTAGTAIYSFGQIIANGLGTVQNVAFADIKLNERIKLTLSALGTVTVGTTPVIVYTPGTGFTFQAEINNTSTYQWSLDS